MLRSWLEGRGFNHFTSFHLGRWPLAHSASAACAASLFGWRTLDALLRRPGLDALVVHDGREEPIPPPRELSGLRPLLDRGVGLVVRRAEREDPGLRELARRFAEDLPGRVHIQLFVTPAKTSSFGWHHDAEELFIVQTQGAKDYYFRRNTSDPLQPGARPDFTRIRKETTPTLTCALEPGDWLYLPRGWWHAAKAREDSLSISLGVEPS